MSPLIYLAYSLTLAHYERKYGSYGVQDKIHPEFPKTQLVLMFPKYPPLWRIIFNIFWEVLVKPKTVMGMNIFSTIWYWNTTTHPEPAPHPPFPLIYTMLMEGEDLNLPLSDQILPQPLFHRRGIVSWIWSENTVHYRCTDLMGKVCTC